MTTKTKESLGSVLVQNPGGNSPELSLTVSESDRHGLQLWDGSTWVTPKSQRLGFCYQGGWYSKFVVGDTTSYDTLRRLRAAGYPVVSHGSQGPGSPLLRDGFRVTLADCERLDPSDLWPIRD